VAWSSDDRHLCIENFHWLICKTLTSLSIILTLGEADVTSSIVTQQLVVCEQLMIFNALS
jgi:hypothetical protein